MNWRVSSIIESSHYPRYRTGLFALLGEQMWSKQAVRDDIGVPERSCNSPSPVRADTRKQSPSPAASVSAQHFSSAEMSSDRILHYNLYIRLLAKDIPSGWNLRRERPAGFSEFK
ncbi:hypothetical protein ILYODFUR_032204 [Ilyodon furcidens]|uniref:Uncharacterized protein n=1 Tax=Ilyodon furcidens TaxID=33524 RepID=A0ABV0UKU3_9TELE